MEQASFVPPDPLTLQSSLDNFEQYLTYEELDTLVQMAIVHAQFEIIHPFNDGNGRVGRMLIPLFLYQKKMISSPMFYISEYFERHRNIYIEHLNNITSKNDWNAWILFFLQAITEQAKHNAEKAKAIIELYEIKKKRVTELIRSQFSIAVVDTLFKMPIFNTTDFINESKIPKAIANRFIKIMIENGILSIVEKGHGRTPSVLVFHKLFDIIK